MPLRFSKPAEQIPDTRNARTSFFSFNEPPTTEIYTLSLHDALPISPGGRYDILVIRQNDDVFGKRGFHRLERSEEHTSELQSHLNLVCRLLLEKKKVQRTQRTVSHGLRLMPRTSC